MVCAGIADARAMVMRGFITERNFEQAETEFPGIVALYEHMTVKPPTFLDLVRVYLEEPTTRDDAEPASSVDSRS
jgi:hypothetical protein